MKRVAVMGMLLGLCAMLFGCAPAETQVWESLNYHVTSSVMTQGCHFLLTRGEEGMYLSGFCYDGGTEYRIDEPRLISQETADAIAAMALENAPAARQKLFAVADGTQVSVTLTYPNGRERRISLSAEQRAQLFGLLQKEMTGT